MSEEEHFDPDVDQPDVGIDQHRGTRMLEVDSYERVVEGLKLASDGARNAACHRNGEQWNKVADMFDKLRVAVCRLGAMGRPGDADRSKVIFGEPRMMLVASYMRVHDGLKGAAAGARQLATCHRGDLRWSLYAMQIDKMREKCSLLVRTRQAPPQLTLH